MTIPNPAATTALDGINAVLRAVGEAPVTSLVGLPADAESARLMFGETLRELATRPWRFNLDRNVAFASVGTVNQNGRAVNVFQVPSDVASATPALVSQNAGALFPDVVIRRARAFGTDPRPLVFANRMGGLDGFTDRTALWLDVVRYVAYDDLPETVRRFVVVRTARRFAQQIHGSAEMGQFSATDEQQAWLTLEREQGIEEDFSIFDSSMTFRHLGGRPRGGWLF